jgi:hypothetical protein
LLADVCGGDDAKWRDARDAAKGALAARVDLWDGVLDTLAARALSDATRSAGQSVTLL